MSLTDRKQSTVRTVCIVGHNPLSTALITHLSKTTSLHIHLLHSSAHILDLPPPLLEFCISNHQHPNSTFTNPEVLTHVLSSLSPPADLVLSTSRGGDYTQQTLLISACVQARIPRFIPAEFGFDSLSPRIQSLLPPSKERARVIAFLRDKQGEEAIEWVGLATGVDVRKRLADGNMGVDLTWQSATVFGTGEERVYASTLGFVGEVVAGVVRGWDGLRNTYLCVAEVETTYRGVLDALEREMECSFEVGYLEQEEGVNEARKRIERGWPDAGMFLLERSVLADEECFRGFARDECVKTKLGLKSGSVDAIVKEVVHDFKHHGKGGCGCS